MKNKQDVVGTSSPRSKILHTKRGSKEATTENSPPKKKLKLTEKARIEALPDEAVPNGPLITRMSPSGIMKFISSASQKQLSDIEELGFGGIMKLKTDTVPGVLAKWLLLDFNTCNCSLMNGALRIEDVDVQLATGLPMGSLEIKEATKYSKDKAFLDMKERWLEQFGGVDNVTKEALLKKLISQKDGGDEFKRNFVVYITSAFLVGSKGQVASSLILNCLGDLSLVPSFNWCAFTRRHMVTSIDNWRADLNENKIYKGPIMPLVFIYLDRVEFKWQTVKRLFPTLSSWSRKDISDRVVNEKKYGFGKGAVLDRIGMPVDEARRGKEKIVLDSQKKSDAEEPNVGSSQTDYMVTKLGKAAVHFAHAYEHFSAALNEAQLSAPNSDFVCKMSALAQGVCDGFNGFQKASEDDVSPSDVNRGTVDDESVRMNDENKGKEHNNKQQHDGDYDFASDAELCAMMEELEKSFVVPPANNKFVKKNKRQNEKDSSVPDFDLGFDHSQDNEGEVPVPDSAGFKEPEPHADKPDFSNQPSTPTSTTQAGSTFIVPESNTTRRISPRLNSNTCTELLVVYPASPTADCKIPLCVSPISTIPYQKEETRGVHLKRATAIPEYFRSPYMQRNIDVFRSLTKLEKLIIDLALLEEDPSCDSEILFKSDHHTITRAQMKTLFSGDRVSESLVNVWGEILNMGEAAKSKSSPLRLYMSRDGQELPEIELTDVKLIFLPYTATGKPFLFCVQPSLKKIEVIHGMKQNSVNYQFSITSCKHIIDGKLKDKLPGIEQLNWLAVQEYVPSQNIGDNLDSGIHVMYFMDTYKGSRKGYSCALSSDTRMKRFIGRACCRILTSELNSLQKKVKEVAQALPTRQCNSGPSNINEVTARDSSGNPLTVKYIKDYMRRSPCDQLEVLVDTQWIEVTLKGVKSLNARGRLMDMVIDAIGIKNCLANHEFLYLPTVVKNLNLKKPETLYTQYVKITYVPEDVNQFKKVFLPFGVDNHWFAAIVDLKKKKTFILDSLADSKTKTAYTNMVRKAVYDVEGLIKREHGYYRLSGMSRFEIEFLPVPQQTNLHDCGLFVLKWIEAVNDEALWTEKDYFKSLNEYRDCKMLELLTWDMNRKKVF